MSINVNLETGTIFFLEQTLESEYLSGHYGAVPIIDWESVGGRPFQAQLTKVAAEITDRKKLAKQLRKIADEIEAKS